MSFVRKIVKDLRKEYKQKKDKSKVELINITKIISKGEGENAI